MEILITVFSALVVIGVIIKSISNLKTFIMATVSELSAKVDELQAHLDTEQEQIQNALNTLVAQNEELKKQIEDLGGSEALQAVADKLDGVISDLKGTIPDTGTDGGGTTTV